MAISFETEDSSNASVRVLDDEIDLYFDKIKYLLVRRCEETAKLRDFDVDSAVTCIARSRLSAEKIMEMILRDAGPM